MRVLFAVACRGIEQLADQTWMLVGIESNMKMFQEFPADVVVPLFITVTSTHPEVAAGTAQEIRLRILGPDLEEVAPRLSVGMTLGRGPLLPDGWDSHGYLPASVTFRAERTGYYSIEVATDENSVSVPLIVTQPAAPPTPPPTQD